MPGDSELWREIPGYCGRYEASNRGRIRSWCVGGSCARRAAKPRMLRLQVRGNGYFYIGLSNKGVVTTWAVHRLIALCFLTGDSTLHVHHIDGCKLNNHAANLVYVSNRTNTAEHYTTKRDLPANVVQRPSGNYHVQAFYKGKKRSFGTYKTLAKAAKIAQFVREDLEDGTLDLRSWMFHRNEKLPKYVYKDSRLQRRQYYVKVTRSGITERLGGFDTIAEAEKVVPILLGRFSGLPGTSG